MRCQLARYGNHGGVNGILENIRQVSPHAEPILVISLTAILGLLIGSVKVRGIKLGVAGMLFSGLLLGHFGLTLDPHLMAFLKEFGLALFVFTVGLQLGPGFFNSLKKDGLKLNALAVLVVLSGALLVFVFGRFLLGWNAGALAGIFSGATTNTPSLGAAQQAMSTAGKADLASQASMAYAVAYPFGVMGIILVMILLRVMFRIDPAKELAELKERMSLGVREPMRASLRWRIPTWPASRFATSLGWAMTVRWSPGFVVGTRRRCVVRPVTPFCMRAMSF